MNLCDPLQRSDHSSEKEYVSRGLIVTIEGFMAERSPLT
jgi:hypothetical protein